MKTKILILFLVLYSSISNSQLTFPKGTILDLNATESVLYFETEILFHTGKYTIDQYYWIKLNDSIDTNWFISSCFNGDCRDGLPDFGSFVKEYGFNDTTGFIRFHVDTKDKAGKSVIRYIVQNKLDSTDKNILLFNISYGVSEITENLFFPLLLINSFGNIVFTNTSFQENLYTLSIFSTNGQKVYSEKKIKSNQEINPNLKGIYIVLIQNDENKLYLKKVYFP